jgi:hypothetical protein
MLAAPLSGYSLDQGALGPIKVFHDLSLTRSRPGVPAAKQIIGGSHGRFAGYSAQDRAGIAVDVPRKTP